MSEENKNKQSPEEMQEMKERWEKRLAGGDPMVSYEFSLPMDVFVGKEGDITIDCPCFQLAGFDRAGVVRVRLIPEAANTLRHALRELEKIEGKPPEEPPKRFSH